MLGALPSMTITISIYQTWLTFSILYRQHMLSHYIFSLRVKGNIYCHSFCYLCVLSATRFISLNFTGILSIVAVISTQFFMLWSENEALYAVTFILWSLYDVCARKIDHFIANLDTKYKYDRACI